MIGSRQQLHHGAMQILSIDALYRGVGNPGRIEKTMARVVEIKEAIYRYHYQ
jgi:hypothetical protein